MSEAVVEFIRQLYPDMPTVPLHVPVLGEIEKTRLCDAIDSGFVSSVGAGVEEFERSLKTFTGVRHVLATVNGTTALQLALLASGIEAGDEVLTQPLSFIATANAIHHCGAEPVFIDIDEERLGLSAKALRSWLEKHVRLESGVAYNRTSGRRVSACIPMHCFGLPVDIVAIKALCDEFCIVLIEDAAESLGSTVEGRHLGTFGACSAMSFNGNKIITTGGGGALLTNDDAIASRARHLATTAKRPHAWLCEHDEVGFNFRMPNVNAMLGCAQMTRLAELLLLKNRLAERYQVFFEGSDFDIVRAKAGETSNYWLVTLRSNSAAKASTLLEQCQAAGIQVRPAWQLLSDSLPYKHCRRGDLSVAERIAPCLLSLPSSTTGLVL